ncbi:putative AAA-ATPase domain containing protein [Elaphomyces granulatus]
MRRGGSLIYDPAKFSDFPQHDAADFRKIRTNPSLVYFDRTKYILNIENIQAEALVFLRPRRFGKSLVVSMMEYFHGIQYRDDYAMLFEDLDIDKEVQAGKVHHNKWLVLKFDFSTVERSPDPLAARNYLCSFINRCITKYCQAYHRYLGYDTFDELVQKMINVGNAVEYGTTLGHLLSKSKSQSQTTPTKNHHCNHHHYNVIIRYNSNQKQIV